MGRSGHLRKGMATNGSKHDPVGPDLNRALEFPQHLCALIYGVIIREANLQIDFQFARRLFRRPSLFHLEIVVHGRKSN